MENDDARYLYEEELRLIGEEEACAVRAAHLSAELQRNTALRNFLRAQRKNLRASSKESYGAKDAAPASHGTPIVNVTTNVTTTASTADAPTYNDFAAGSGCQVFNSGVTGTFE